MIDRLRQRHIPNYRKADDAIMPDLLPHMDEAIANAERIETTAENDSRNPYTVVHYVLKHFARVATQP